MEGAFGSTAAGVQAADFNGQSGSDGLRRVERSRDVAAECGKAEKDSGGRVLRGAAKSGDKAVQGEEKSEAGHGGRAHEEGAI